MKRHETRTLCSGVQVRFISDSRKRRNPGHLRHPST